MYISEVENPKTIRGQNVEIGYIREAVKIGAKKNKCLKSFWKRKGE